MGLARAAVFAGCLLLFLAVDASGNKCTVGCHGMHGGKAYQEGHTYIYDLEGTSVTSVPGAQGDAILKLKGTVELSVKPDCIRQIRLKGVQINGAPISLPDVEKHALQFNYHDGHIDTEVCIEPGDSQASLNIKRAVTSLFQSAVIQESGSTTHHEIDVFGGCPTDFTFHKDGDSLVIHKERDLIRCSHRESIRSGPVAAIYDQKSDIQSAPLLSSHQKIEQRFKRGILNKATSAETYKLKPWSNGDIGAKTVVQTTLTLKGEKGDSPNAAVSQPRSLIFEAPHPVIKSSPDSLAAAVKAASAEEHGGVKHDAAEKFAQLVKVLRLSSKNDILTIYQKVKNGNGFDKVLDKKIFLDALFRAGSGEAAEVSVNLLKSHELSGVQALMFYASLALVNHVNLPSVTAVTSLLDEPNLPRLGYLGIGQIIGKYCQEHTCENVAEVKQAVHKIREKVGNGKAKTREQENLVVSALKALGNTKYLDDATLQKVVGIAEDKNVRNRVRVAAIEALPTRCSMKWKNILLKVLGNREEDSEIRIKSYLALVACPCPHVAEGLKETLDKETVNQVGSFIQSHLRNLRASADPSKADAKRHLGQIKPRTKFPEDFRKFSFNNELSYNVGGVGVGSSAESNVIYSQNSFVPRSLNLNLTTEIFGRSFNFLELNTRIENLDRLIEHYFGPKSRLTQGEAEELVEKGVDKAENIINYIKEKVGKLRSKREVKQGELDKFAKGVKLRSNEVDQQLDFDLSVKLFGVELAYLTYDGNPTELTPEHIIDKVFNNLEDGISKIKKFDYNLQNHMQFLDAEVVYPTNLGLALSLGVIGTSVVHIKTYGRVDIPAIVKNPNNADVHFGLQPSASIRVAGNLVVKGFDVESGMKLVSTLHTDTASDITVKLLDGKGVDVVVGLPKKKEELISISSEVLLSSGDAYKAAKFGKGKVYKDCFEQLSSVLGVTICGHVEFPYDGIDSVQKRALFPLNGPSKFSINNENNDLATVHLKIHHDKSPKSRSFEILLETPSSKTNRRMSFIAEAGVDPKHAKLAFDSPFKKASIEAAIKEDPQERSLTITLHNDNQEYYGRVGLLASGAKYKPILEYKVPEHIEKLASTKTGLKPSRGGQQYEVQGTVEVVDQDGGKKYVFDKVALVASGQKIVGLDGYVHSTENAADLDMKVNYGEESVALKLQAKKKDDSYYSISVSALPSKDPNIGFNIQSEIHREPYAYKYNLVFIHGPDHNSKINRFSLEHDAIVKPNQDGQNFVVGGSTKISYPAVKLKLELEGKIKPTEVEGKIGIAYDKFKFGSKLSAEQNKDKVGDYEVEFEAELLQNSIKLESKRTIIDPHKSKYKNKLELVPGGKYEADALVTYNRDKNNKKVNFEIDSDLKLDDKKVKVFGSLNVDHPNIQSQAYVIVSDVKYVDFLLKLQQQNANPQGSLTLNVKNYLDVTGQISMQNGKGKAQLNIDLPKINRKIKGTGDLTVSGTQHNGDFELLYDAEKDPNKRIKLSTANDIKKNAIDTKNVLEIMSHKFELNGKGKLDGTMNEGELAAEADVTLPNGRRLAGNLKRTSKKDDNNKYTIDINGELEDQESKGSKSQKLTVIQKWRDVDFKMFTFQADAQIKAVDHDGNSVQAEVKAKNLLETDGHKKVQGFSLDLSGSRLPKPLNLQLESSERDDGELSCKNAFSYGKDLQLKSSHNFVPGNEIDKPCAMKGNVELILPSEKLRNVKLDHTHNLLIQSEIGGVVDLKGSTVLTYNDDKTTKIEGAFKSSGIGDGEHPYENDLQLELAILNIPPISFHDHEKYEPNGDKMTVTSNTIVKYDQKEITLALNPLTYNRDLTQIDVKAKATTPYEKLRNVDLELKHERGKVESRKTDVILTLDGTKHTLHSEIRGGTVSPMVHITVSCPNTEGLVKLDKLGDQEYKGEWKIKTPKGFVSADGHVKLQSIDDFVINANWDSDKLKHRKMHAEIANSPTAKAGKRIVITVTSDGKNIVTGSTNYKKRDEAGKITIEGSGNLKIGEDTRSSSFKYTRQQLTREKDGESGVLIVLNAKFDPAAIVGEVKLSNKELLVFNSYCEQSKDCAHFKLQSTYDTDNKNYLNHEATVEVDLKKFNVPAEFGLKTSTEVKESKLDHSANLYLHSSKDKSQYSYKLYIHPKESAAILTLPSRELAVIGTFDLPKTKQTGAFKVDVSVYLDRKNKPSDKTALVASGDVNIEKSSGSISGEVKFIYPSQPKDMAVKGKLHYGGEHLLDANVDIDVFAKKTQKINVVAKLNRQYIEKEKGYNVTSVIEVSSRGQQLKVDLKTHVAITQYQVGFGSILSYTDVNQKPQSLGVLVSADPTEAYILVTSPNKKLIEVVSRLELKKNLQKLDMEVEVLGNKPIVINFEAHDWNSFTYSEHLRDNPNTKLVVNGRVVLGQLAEIHADAFKDGVKKEWFHGLIHLDEEKFLKPDFGYNKDNIAYAIEHYRSHGISLLKQIKETSNEIVSLAEQELKDLVEHLKKAQPNLKPLLDYYEAELNKLKDELNADQTIKDIQATLHKYFGAIITAISDTLKQVTARLNELYKEYAELLAKLEDIWKTVYPQLKESYNKIANAYINLIDSIANVSLAYLKTLLALINEHQKELKELAVVASELVQDVAKIVFKASAQIRKDVEEFVLMLKNQMQALPIFDIAKEQYQDIFNFQIPESILASIHELSEIVKAMLPTEELRQLFSSTYEYIMKHVKHEKVDNTNEIKKIYGHAVDAVGSLIKLLESTGALEHLIDDLLEARLPIEFELLTRLPAITSIKVSLVNLIRNNELPSVADLYYAYRPTLLLSDIIPPFIKFGVVVDGGHIFTFDGNHLSMPGDCTYVLAQDMQDGNFSVVANFNKGNLVSVTVTEPKESITLKNNGNVLVNNKPADFPASTKNLHAFLVHTTLNIKSDYGVHVLCTRKQSMVCTVSVSGFYHGKLRGLLGDGNNEYYDDYTLPSGKITESETEFANGYKLKPDCAAVNAIDHKAKQRNPVCTDYFSGQKSSLKKCFDYINPTHYRDACDAAANGNPQAPCSLATAYYASCYYKRVSGISIPSTCTSCKVGENTIAVGDTFSVKSPKNQADIVVVVEQVEENEKVFKDLIPTLITDLREELKQHGITDVHIGLIGFAEHMKWPQHYTTGGSTNIEGEVKNMKFDKPEPIITFEEAKKGDYEKKLTYLEQRLDVEIGNLKLKDAYVEAINYPFRPGAIRAVVSFLASPCEKSPLPLSLQQLRLLIGHKVYRDLGLTYYHVYNTNDIQVSGKVQKNIVGYDSDSVYVFADNKKKPLSGNTELRNNMVLPTVDVCADFAVESGGAAFSSSNLVDAKPNQKRQFAQVTARKIAEDLTSVEIEQDCVCDQFHGMEQPRCKIVGRKEKEQLARHTKGGVKG